MLRPATLLRSFTVPIRLLAAQQRPATLLARRCFAATARSSSSTSPPSEPPSTTTTTPPAAKPAPAEVSSSETPSSTSPADGTTPPKPRRTRTRAQRAAIKARRIKFAQIRARAKAKASISAEQSAERAAARQEKARQRRPKQLPYRVSRTPSLQLAVYELAKRGGNLKLTTVKKVEGDRAAFRADLARGLGFGEGDKKAVWVNSLTGHVIVAGHRKNEVVGWLEKQGF